MKYSSSTRTTFSKHSAPLTFVLIHLSVAPWPNTGIKIPVFDYPVLLSVRKKKDCLCVVLYIVVTTSRHKNRQEIHFRLSASCTVGNIISYLILFLHGGSPPIPRMVKRTKNSELVSRYHWYMRALCTMRKAKKIAEVMAW